MTDRGLPIVDGAPACPFVAFEDDRDARALAPDHRHRCFAETRPASRAVAHQAAYCLSSAFPVCPAFQDWARREAAAARPSTDEGWPVHDEPPVSTPMPPREREARHGPSDATPPPLPPRRNPHRDWAAPPPWAAGEVDDDRFPRDPRVADPASRGLADSAAARFAGPDPDALEMMPARYEHPPARVAPVAGSGAAASAQRTDADPAPPPRDTARRPVTGQAHRGGTADPEEIFGPAWERPQRYEAYPTLRARFGLPTLGGISRIGIAAISLLMAAALLFFVGPMLLGLGGKDAGPSQTPEATIAVATPTPEPTPVPEPTPQIYVVAKGDTILKIAKKFGVTAEQLMAANPKIKNPDRIKIGDEIIIPVPTTDTVPDAGGGEEITSAP